MPTSNDLPIGAAYQSIQDVISGLAKLEQVFLKRRDRRAVFVTAYLQITQELKRRIETSQFQDNAWVGSYIVAFANLYRQALAAYENGDLAAVPQAWRLSLDTSAAGVGLVIQDLLLGINAHINHDLPLALKEVGIEPGRRLRYEDHTAVNNALREATETVQERIASLYASGLGVLDHLLGNLDEGFTSFSFEAAREHAWNMGVALVTAQSEQDKMRLTTAIDRQATLVARLILAPNTPFPWLIEALRTIEQIKPWWEHLLDTQVIATRAINPFAALRDSMRSEVPLASAPPSSLDEVIQRLGEIITRFDQERNRLSIYATVYRRITKKVKATVEAGGFQDPAWMTHLDLHFADRYFRTLDLYLAGRLNELPRCWAFALEAIRTGRTMIVQDIVLQIVPRVVHDLPLTLREAGLDQDIDKRFHDYEKTYELFTSELDDIQDMIARKYSSLVAFEDILTGRLDEMISDVLYTRARKEAWADGLALHNESSDNRRQQLIRQLDRKAVQSSNKALFWDFPPIRWMCQALRKL